MTQAFDGFGDLIEGDNGGSLGGDGLKALDSVRRRYTGDGMLVEVNCGSCGKARHCTIPWPEIIALKFNVNPARVFSQVPQLRPYAAEWANTSQHAGRGVLYAWYPSGLRCRCGVPFNRPLITPAECESHLVEMRQRQAMSPQLEQQLSQICSTASQQPRR